MKIRSLSMLCLILSFSALSAEENRLIVVQDSGGASALPYYETLHLQGRNSPDKGNPPSSTIQPGTRYKESDFLPVRSTRLTPGSVERRAINAPGLTTIFLVGDDDVSRAWLRERYETLRELRAVGFVVRVESAEALAALRKLAPGLTLSPSPADDMAQRLNLQHYPVLIRTDRIEQ